MPKVLITGNGFDLSLGLPTKYIDFMKVMDKIEMLDGNDNVDRSDLLKSSSIATELNITGFPIVKETLNEFKDMLSNNLWYQFFKKELQNEKTTWIDFENRIKFALEKLIGFGYISRKDISVYTYQSFVTINESNNQNLIEIKLAQQFKIIYENDNVLFIDSRFIEKREDLNIDFNFNELANYLFQDFEKFEILFTKYFQLFVLPLIPDKSDNFQAIRHFSNIEKHYTFNYTPTYDKEFSTYNSITSNIHGKIESNFENIVLGVHSFEDEDKLELKGFRVFLKSHQILQKNTQSFDIENFLIQDNSGNEIVFFGHSMDTSDERYIKKVFNLVPDIPNQINNSYLIKIYCHNIEEKSKIISNLQNIVGEEKLLNLRERKQLEFVTGKPDFLNSNNNNY